jgi:hypothetical protein
MKIQASRAQQRRSFPMQHQFCFFRDDFFPKHAALVASAARAKQRTVIYDIKGGAFFLEDGVEIHNTLQYNLAVFVKESSSIGYKILFAKSYRPPSFNQIETTPANIKSVVAETTDVAEVEINTRPGKNSNLAVNIFYSKLNNPINLATNGSFYFTNSSPSGSHGIEMSYQFRNSAHQFSATAGYYSADGHQYHTGVEGHSQYNYAAEDLKINVRDTLKFSNDVFFITPSVTYIGRRYGYDYLSGPGIYAQREFDPKFLSNLVFEKRRFWRDNIDLTLAINNIFRINELSADTSRHLLLIRQGQNRYLSQSNRAD